MFARRERGARLRHLILESYHCSCHVGVFPPNSPVHYWPLSALLCVSSDVGWSKQGVYCACQHAAHCAFSRVILRLYTTAFNCRWSLQVGCGLLFTLYVFSWSCSCLQSHCAARSTRAGCALHCHCREKDKATAEQERQQLQQAAALRQRQRQQDLLLQQQEELAAAAARYEIANGLVQKR